MKKEITRKKKPIQSQTNTVTVKDKLQSYISSISSFFNFTDFEQVYVG